MSATFAMKLLCRCLRCSIIKLKNIANDCKYLVEHHLLLLGVDLQLFFVVVMLLLDRDF